MLLKLEKWKMTDLENWVVFIKSNIWIIYVCIIEVLLYFVLLLLYSLTSDVGHLDFLEKVSKEGDYLIVGIHTDSVSCYVRLINNVIWAYFFVCKY